MDKRIGIIGGAGPTAGLILFEKILEVCQKQYECTQDSDFPHTNLISFPFSDMLSKNCDKEVIQKELQICFDSLKQNSITIAAIGCNTLHAFLSRLPDGIILVHMIEETKKRLKENNWKKPLILCSSTAASEQLHSKFFACRYPDRSLQTVLDDLIIRITFGDNLNKIAGILNELLDVNEPTVLGCTEFSLLNERVPLNLLHKCDPNSIVAEAICKLYYANKSHLASQAI